MVDTMLTDSSVTPRTQSFFKVSDTVANSVPHAQNRLGFHRTHLPTIQHFSKSTPTPNQPQTSAHTHAQNSPIMPLIGADTTARNIASRSSVQATCPGTSSIQGFAEKTKVGISKVRLLTNVDEEILIEAELDNDDGKTGF